MNENKNFKNILDRNILFFFRKLTSLSFIFPSYLPFMIGMLFSQIIAIKRRNYWKTLSLEVPPILITSITNRCNLKCTGCYNKPRENTAGAGMEKGMFLNILKEAMDIGSRIIFISGGEPMTRPDILSLTTGFPHILFPLFTNGLLITEGNIKNWKKQKNIVPVISLEGGENETDECRGSGVYNKIEKLSLLLKKSGILYGHSMTATRNNFKLLTDIEFIRRLYKSGARVFIFVEYQQNGNNQTIPPLTSDEKGIFLKSIEDLRKAIPGIFIEFPGEEGQYEGCLSAGRGFLHISADGSLEPCPFSPYSDSNLKNLSLKEALNSAFLRKIRDNHPELKGISGCALLEKREWVKSLL